MRSRKLTAFVALVVALFALFGSAPAAIAGGPGAVGAALPLFFGAPVNQNGAPTDGYVLTYSAANGAWAAAVLPGNSFGNQTANRVFAGPSSGGAAQPTFRALVAADIPANLYPLAPTGGGAPGVSGANAVAGGQSAQANYGGTAFGVGAAAQGTGLGNNINACAFGQNAAAARRSVAIGCLAGSNTAALSIGLGYNSQPTADNQFVMGGDDGSGNGTVSSCFIGGNGVTDATPAAVTWTITGASGANVAGSNLTIAGSRGTGTGVGGSLIFQVATHGGSSSTPNALVTALTIDETKLSTFGGAITAGGTVTVGANTLALASSTVSGTPTWSSSQAITLSTAAQANVTSLGTLTSLTMGGALTMGANTLALASSTVSGAPTWSSSQAITLSTAAQANVTSLGTLTGLVVNNTIQGVDGSAGTALTVRAGNGSAGAGALGTFAGGNGAGTNQVSGGLTLSGGSSSGNAAPVAINIQCAPAVSAGGSGSGTNAVTTLASLLAVQNNLASASFAAGAAVTLSNVTFGDGGGAGTGSFCGLLVSPTLNYTNGTKAQAFDALRVALTETSDPTGSINLINLLAGASGTTSEFKVTNGGAGTFAGTLNSGAITSTGQISGTQFNFTGSSSIVNVANSQVRLSNNAGNGLQGLQLGSVAPTYPGTAPANGETLTIGTAMELLTLSTSGTTTDTAANLLPAGAFILAVDCRITTTITTATNWSVGDATTAARFSAANSTLTSGTTSVGITQLGATGAASGTQAAAAKVRITTTGTPGAGVIRITVHYIIFSAATS